MTATRLVIILAILGCLYTLSHGQDIERMEEGNKIVVIPCVEFKCDDIQCMCCEYDNKCYRTWKACQINCVPPPVHIP
ncbi:unnamed protein product [Musa acuminata var. zebrina]